MFTDVPINATAPIAFAKSQIKYLFPNYEYVTPRLIETQADNGRLPGPGVHFPPVDSRPA